MAQIPNEVKANGQLVQIIRPADPPTTISQHLLATAEMVAAEEHKTKVPSHHEIAFLELVLANQANPQIVMAMLRRRQQFLKDSLVADFPTALFFLTHNDKYAALDAHDREQKLVAHKKSTDEEKTKKHIVTAVIQQPQRQPQRGHPGRWSRGRGRQQGYYPQQSSDTYYPQQQFQQFQVPQPAYHHGPPPQTPSHTRSGRGFSSYNPGGRGQAN
jgi:hypothetical protein